MEFNKEKCSISGAPQLLKDSSPWAGKNELGVKPVRDLGQATSSRSWFPQLSKRKHNSCSVYTEDFLKD